LALHHDFSGDELERALGGLDRGRPALGGEAFERILDAETGSVARPGTSVEMLFDGVTSFEKRYELIAGAKTSINLQTFYFGDDNTGWKTARALADAAGRGVKVRVVYDAWASGKVDPAVFKHMREAGVEVAAYGDPFKEPLKINSRWHEKVLVVDGGAAILGGMNIGDEYALGGTSVSSVPNAFGHEGPPWRDTDVLIQGPAVADAQRAFLKNWSDLGRSVSEADRNALFPELAELPDGEGVRFVQHRPADDGDDNTKALYLQAIRSAKKSIRIENAYLVPPPEIKAALIDVARRGVKVEMLTNGEDSVDVKLLVHTGRYHYDDLVEAGVKIYETQGGTLHSKTAIFDDQLTIVGSANLNGRSDGRDSESVVLAYDPGTAATNAARFGRGVSKATEVTAADLEEDSAWDNLKQWGLALFSWTI
jgi:cardiolipin synthase